MTTLTNQQLLTFVPDINHPDINAMRNCLHAGKIDIPVRLYKDGTEVYSATVYMIGHTHSLYKAALMAVLDGIAKRTPALEWDQVSFHSEKTFAKDEYLKGPSPLSDYITIFRGHDFAVSMETVQRDFETVIAETDIAKKRVMFEHNILRRCAAIIATSVEVKPDPAYVAKRGLIARFMPKF